MTLPETDGAAPAPRTPSSAEAPLVEVVAAGEAGAPTARDGDLAPSARGAAELLPDGGAATATRPSAFGPIAAADAPLVDVAGRPADPRASPRESWTAARLEPQDVLDPLPSPGRLQRLAKRLGLDERGNSVMTIIVIMAGLMAAGTAGVIFLQGADHLKETGSEVSEEAADSTLASMRLVEVYGESKLGRVTVLHEVLTPGPASPDIPLDAVVVSLAAGDTKTHYTYAGSPAEGNFTVQVIRDSDGSMAGAIPHANKGDLVEIVLPLPGDGLLPRSVIQQAIILEGGNQLTSKLEVPTAVTGELVQFRL